VLRWTRLDTLFALAAALSVLVLALVLPSQHPDAAADLGLGQDGAEQAARAALSELGYSTSDWNARTLFSRDTALLDSLQHSRGRQATVQLLADEGASEQLPAYYWDVALARPDADAQDEGAVSVQFSRSPSAEAFTSFGVRLSQQGRLIGLRAEADESVGALLVDRQALAAALSLPQGDTLLASVSDSLLAASFGFDARVAEPQGSRNASHSSTLVEMLARAQTNDVRVFVTLEQDEAVRMARWHLERLDLLDHDWSAHPDSVSLEGEAARVHYDLVVEGQRARVEADVLPAGRLSRLDVDFSPGASEREASFLIYSVGMGIVYALLGLTLLVYFVRRLSARVVDMRTALIDGALIALPSAAFTMLVSFSGANGVEAPPWWTALILFPFLFLLYFLGLTILAGSTEGLAREVWGDKMRASTLLRRANVLNERVGFALTRGTLAGVALAGVSALLLALVPLPMRLSEDFSLAFLSLPVRGVVPVMMSAATTYTTLVAALLGVASFFERRGTPKAVTVGVSALVITLLGATAFLVSPAPVSWALSFPVAVGLVLLFLRYDFLTAFAAMMVWPLAWYGIHYLVLGDLLATIEALIVGVVIVGLAILGAVGVRSKRSGDEEPDYVPTYVSEMAQQERMKQELEFARQVQTSFLPRRMPEVRGVDAAALCIAASEVGGDYYDLVDLGGGRLAVAIGDVSGKGIQAAFYMTLVKGFLRSLIRQFDSPADVLRHLNALFCENAPRGTFISMIFGILDVNARTFTFARAGHNPLILQRIAPPGQAKQPPEFAQPRGVGIGFLRGEGFDARIEEQTLSLQQGDAVVLYTDGFSEAMNPARLLYGDDRLALSVSELSARSAAEIVGGVATSVQQFARSAPQHDDMTIVAFRLTGAD
jgi:serine phosphatase RsbU (regulator of sigma subunit)